MVVKINENYFKLKSSYLFVEVARREAEFVENNPDADVIKMGIGDVTKPLTLPNGTPVTVAGLLGVNIFTVFNDRFRGILTLMSRTIA